MEKTSLAPPSPWLLLSEGRALGELTSSYLGMRWLRRSPRGDGHPVLVLPGFLASDRSTTLLRSFLQGQGYRAHRWRLGHNLGPKGDLEDRMQERLEELHQKHGARVSLLGWSLGGIYARILAHRVPQAVRSVITLASPFAQDPKANHSWRLFEWLSGSPIDDLDHATLHQIRSTPPVPTTAIYSRYDGITAWQCCVEAPGPRSESIEVNSSHIGMGCHPRVLYAIADRLSQPEASWKPFDRRGLHRILFREPAGPASATNHGTTTQGTAAS